jgi:hypothetical protein
MKKNIMKIATICLFTLLPLKAEQLSREQKDEVQKLITHLSREQKEEVKKLIEESENKSKHLSREQKEEVKKLIEEAEHLSREQKNDIIKFMRNYERINKDCASNSHLSSCSDKPGEAMWLIN